MNSPRSRRAIPLFQVLVLVALAVVFWGLRAECLWSESNKVACLASVERPIFALRDFVATLFQGGMPYNLYAYSIYCALGAIGVLTILLLAKRSLPLWGFFYLVTLTIACVGDLCVLRKETMLGVRLHLLSVLPALVSLALLWRKDRTKLSWRWGDPDNRQERSPSRWECLVVAGVFTLLVITRFHQLNINPPAWDTESCGHRSVAASWSLMVDQELERLSQQSSGMSWTVLHHYFTRVDDPLLFDLDQRLLGVAISFVCCWAVYFLMRFLGGPFAAIFALVVYGFGPLDLHWSRLPTFHHLPVCVGILLAWASFAAFSRRTWGAFGAMTMLVVITKFVYPSAKLIALGPVMGMFGVLLWEKREWMGHRRKFALLVVGLALFALFRTLISPLGGGEFRLLAPFAQIQPVHNGNSLMTTAQLLGREVLEFFRLLYVGPIIPSHYTIHATSHPWRSIPSVGIVFLTVMFVHLLFTARRTFSLICIGLLIGGVVPAIVTGMDERRVSFVLVFLTLLALLEFEWFMEVLIAPALPRVAKVVKGMVVVLLVVFMGAYQTQAFFSRPAARPIQHLFNEELRRYVVPDTLVVNLSPEHDCSAFYGMYDLVRDSGGRIAFVSATEAVPGVDPIVNPAIRDNTWHYRYTDLKEHVSTVLARQEWPRKLYILVGDANREDLKQRLRAQYPNGREILIEGPGVPPLTAVLFETAPATR